jgi:hypothetical protein
MDGDDGLLCLQAVSPLTAGQRPSTGCNQCWAVIGESVGSWLELTVLGYVELQVAEMNAQESSLGVFRMECSSSRKRWYEPLETIV